MKVKELLNYILYTQKYRIVLYDDNMNVISASSIINNNLFNRVCEKNIEYLECNVIGISSELDYIKIDVKESK